MFQRYAQTVLDILTLRGSFDTDPATLVNHAIEALSGLLLADQIATASEVADAAPMAPRSAPVQTPPSPEREGWLQSRR